MKIVEKIIGLIVKRNDSEISIIPIQRNEPCFCGSGIKYKKCHAIKLESKNKVACRLVDRKNGNEEYKVFRKNSNKFKSNLSWLDIGVGSNDKLE